LVTGLGLEHAPTGYYWRLRTPDGGIHKMVVTSNADFYRVVDGTGWLYQQSNCTLTDKDGIVYVFGCTPETTGELAPMGHYPAQLQYVQDTNKNTISLNYTTQQID